MVQRYLVNLTLTSVLATTFLASTSAVFGQGVDTPASKCDWEEINFDFNSSVLTDGFPSLLKLADVLKANPNYKVTLEGHADGIGPENYNTDLGRKRADAVAAFLLKYGAAAGQVATVTKGKGDPKVKGEKPYYSPTDEARWMNRRVTIIVRNGNDVISPCQAAAPPAPPAESCCDTVREILKELKQVHKELQDARAKMDADHQTIEDLIKAIKPCAGCTPNGPNPPTNAPDYAVSANPSALSVAPGGPAATGTITVTPSNGFSGPVALSTAGLPAGVTAKFDPPTINGGGSSAMTVTAAKDVKPGTYPAMVQATGPNGVTHSVPLLFTVTGKSDHDHDHDYAAHKDSKVTLLGANVGADDTGHTTASAKARYFSMLNESTAVQAQGEYMYYRGQKEGQFDLGLVDRIGNFQGGVFGSLKYVKLAGGSGVNLGQAAITGDYLFKYGKVGLFGTKGFMDGGVSSTVQNVLANGGLAPNLFTETYLRIVDQVGLSTALGLTKNVYLEGNLGYLRSYGGSDRPGGTLRLIFPMMKNRFAFTAEGGVNETLIGNGTHGRAVFGIQMGNIMNPRNYVSSGKPVPVDIPRVRYEVLSRTVVKGTLLPPIADAGPDQLNIPAGTVKLDGSNSYDPNGETLTYQWVQEIGPAVTLSAPTSAVTSFTAAAGTQYAFRLTVTNTSKLTGSARARVTTTASLKPQILFFIANPSSILPGQTSQLQWQTLNADTVTLGTQSVSLNGTQGVSPTMTTTYTLTATNANGSTTAQTVVTVGQTTIAVNSCFITPASITKGESATLVYSTTGAQSVNIQPGIGSAPLNGSIVIMPQISTTYTVTATSSDGRTDTCSAAVTVTTQPSLPRIDQFTATPSQIVQGNSSTLAWTTENATSVSISTLGSVAVSGSQSVMPSTTTTYTLTATNSFGSVTATARVRVIGAAKITSFTANPPTSPSPGSPVILKCLANNSTSVDIEPNNGQGVTATSSSTQVFPQQTTTYTCTAMGRGGTMDTQTLTVNVTQPSTGGGGKGTPPVVNIAGGPIIQAFERQVTLDASGSTSPSGNLPLTFLWTVRNGQAAILNPTSPTPIVELSNWIGDYYFDLTVTDSKGNSSTGTVIVRLLKQPIVKPVQ